jgi:hypothetical protein
MIVATYSDSYRNIGILSEAHTSENLSLYIYEIPVLEDLMPAGSTLVISGGVASNSFFRYPIL